MEAEVHFFQITTIRTDSYEFVVRSAWNAVPRDMKGPKSADITCSPD